MKNTGIIRRLDRLGRVVIPSELRKTMNISCNDPIEIFTDDDGNIIMRKYAFDGALQESVSALRNTIEEYGDKLPARVADELKRHCAEMKKLIGRK